MIEYSQTRREKEVRKLNCRILIVEDDPVIAQMTQDYFTAKSSGEMKICTAESGLTAVELFQAEAFDLVLLDVMLPDIDGFSVCRKIRENSSVPVIFITARTLEEDKLFGYDLGCDDYVTKPFSLAELFAKSRALLKRASGNMLSSELVCGDIRLDVRLHQVCASGKEVTLPLKEFEILRYLMKNSGQLISRDMILDVIWGRDYFGRDRVVDNHIRKLRKALGASGSQIKTVTGKGYKITD